MPLTPTTRRVTPGRVALALGLAGVTGLSAVSGVGASSHREAPLISNDPAADNTDVYAFVSPDQPDTVTLIANWLPAQDPAAGPNYFNFADDVLYAIHVDNDGDAIADVSYEWRYRTEILDPDTFLYVALAENGQVETLDDPDYNLRQVQDLYVVKDGVRTTLLEGEIVPPSNVGPISTPNYADLADEGIYGFQTENGTGLNFSGQRDDAFFADIGSIFDLGQLRPFQEAYQPARRPNEPGRDFFAGQNIHTTSVQVPIADLLAEGSDDPVIGVWSTASRPKVRVYNQNSGADPVNRGRFVQVSRLGAPLVNEVVIPLGLKDIFNTLAPQNDAAALSTPEDEDGVTIPLVQRPELAGIITAAYGIETPPAPRNDLVSIFLTGIEGLNQPETVQPAELLRLNTSIEPTPFAEQNRLGLLAGQQDGFPNGRRLGDDVIDIALRAVAGGTPFTPDFNVEPNNLLADGVDANETDFLPTFPYQATPWQGYGENNETRGRTTGSE